MELEQRLYNGDRAREVLENEAFIEAFERVEKELIESWRNTPSTSNNQDARERIHLSLTLLGKVRSCIHETMETGKLARLELEHKKSLAQRAKQILGG